MFGVGIAHRLVEGDLNSPIQSYYFDVRHPEVRAWMETAFCDVKMWVNQYIKYDCHMMRESGFHYPRSRTSCTMVREALIDENKYEYGLDVLSWKYLNRGKKNIWDRLAEIFGGTATKEKQIQHLQNAPESLVSEYAQEDARNALEIHEAQDKIILEEDLLHVYGLEMRFLACLIDMERDGVRVDLDRAMEAHRMFNRMIRDGERDLQRILGRPVNVRSPVDKKAIFQVHQRADGVWYTGDGLRLEMTPPSKTFPEGQPQLDSTRMRQSKMPGADLVVNITGWMKARDTFIETYMLEMSHEGYIHASFNQTRTEDGNGVYTGRISITDPALQQIHKRDKKMAAIVRACFIADDGTKWSCHDWSQMDFRMFAHFLNDSRINKMYAENRKTDFHKLTAEMTGLPRDRDEKTGGANAKQINLACVFGMGAGELAKQCSLPYTKSDRGYLVAGPEAKAMFGKYHRNIPGVNTLRSSVESVAKSRGHIRTQLGRRIRFPGGVGSHKAAGLLYQATAADAMKIKAVEVHDYLTSLPDYRGRMHLLVHDEFDKNLTPEAFEDGTVEEITSILERFDGKQTPLKFRIPIVADHGFGDNWWEASK
jgi:DNA polymerase-1